LQVFAYVPILGSVTIEEIIAIIAGLIIIWVLVSIPVYIAGKIVTGGASSLGDAMIATLFGPIVYALTVFLVDFFLGGLIGSSSNLWALVFAFIAWLWVFKASFKTGWLRALAIAILAVLVFTAISLLFGALLNVVVPTLFFPRF
jgi:hypothetical protein